MNKQARSRPWLIWPGLFLLLVLLLSGGLAGLFWPQVVAALTLPPERSGGRPIRLTAVPSSPATGVPSPRATAAAWTTLADDTFQRANQLFWGKATDGQLWGADANNIDIFSIYDDRGQITHGQGAYAAILGPMATDAEVVFSGAISRFNHTSLGAVLRWQDTQNWYKATLDGAHLIISRKVAGITTRLGIMSFAVDAGTVYMLRFRAEGRELAVKAWPTGSSEPAAWLMTVQDTSLQAGYAGLHVVVRNSVTVTITTFSERGMASIEGRSKL
ncbi:MAG: hypothetical protein NVSMB27_17090 [Ktedonobacteraceae bacterium]